MAIGLMQKLPEGMGAENYDAINAKMGVDENPPAGLKVHTAGELDGRFTVIDIWESRADFDRFRDERLIPALHAVVGAEAVAQGPPEITEWELHHLLVP